jgi:hypothetical protein
MNREVTTLENFSDSRSGWSRSKVDRRAGPRYTFLALVELTDTAGVMCIEGRLREISSKGCYVNTPSTFLENTMLQVVITRDEENFKSNGKVVYVHDGIGMGLVFVDTDKDQLEILHSWLAGLASTEVL